MMRKQIVMPAHLMDDGEHGTRNSGRNLFAVRGVAGLAVSERRFYGSGCRGVHCPRMRVGWLA